jgi:hypothetical protein
MVTFKINNSKGKVPAIQSFLRCLSRIKSMKKKEVGSGVGSGSGSPTLLIVNILIISETVALGIL